MAIHPLYLQFGQFQMGLREFDRVVKAYWRKYPNGDVSFEQYQKVEPRIERKSQEPEPTIVWIYRSNIKARAHIWTGADTVCRMAMTGGLGRNWRRKYTVHADRGAHEICSMCQTNFAKIDAKPKIRERPHGETTRMDAHMRDQAGVLSLPRAGHGV